MTTMWSILERRSAPPAVAVPPIAVTATSARSVSRDRARRRPTMATSPKPAFGMPREGSQSPPGESTGKPGGTRPFDSAAGHGEQLPVALDALEAAGAAVGQGAVGAGDQVADGPGDEDLPGGGLAEDAGGDVDGDPADVVAADFDLAGVQAGADLEVDVAELLAEADRAGDGPPGAVEGGQEAVAGRLDHPPAPLLDQAAADVVVDLEQVPPAAVAELAGPLGRGHDVGEQDRGQHPGRRGGLADPGQELLDGVQGELGGLPGQGPVGAGQLDQPGVGDVLGQVAAVLDREQGEVAAVQHQGGRLDQGQEGSHGDLEQGPQEGVGGPGAGHRALHPGHPAAEALVAGAAGDGGGHGLGRAPGVLDPGDDGLGPLWREPDRVVVGGHVAGAGVAEDQGPGPLRTGGGEEQGHRAGLGGGGHEGRLLRAGGVHDRCHLIRVGLPGRRQGLGQRVGGAGAAAVEQDQPRKRGQPAQEQGRRRVLPLQVHVAEGAQGQHQVGSFAEHLVGDPVVAHPGVDRLGLHAAPELRGPSWDSTKVAGDAWLRRRSEGPDRARVDLRHLRQPLPRGHFAARRLRHLRRRAPVGAAVRPALDHRRRAGRGRPPRRRPRGRARPARDRGRPAGGHRPAGPAGPNRRREPALGPARLPGRGGRGGRPGGRWAARRHRQPPPLLRVDGRVEPGLRRRGAGAGGRRRLADLPAGAAAGDLVGDAGGAGWGHPGPVRRPLPGQRGRALGRGGRRGRGAAERRHHLRHPGRGSGHLRAQRPQPAAPARAGRPGGGRGGAALPVRPHLRRLVGAGAAPGRQGGGGALGRALYPVAARRGVRGPMSARAWLLFGAVSVVWGVPYFFIKVAVDAGVPPGFVAWSRVALGALLLVPAAWRRGALRGLGGHWPAVLAYAACEVALPFVLIATSEQYVASSLAAILISSMPLMVALISTRLSPADRPAGLRLVGLLLGIDVAGRPGELLGAVLILVATLCYATASIIVDRGLADLDPMGPIAASLGLAALVLAPVAVLAPPDELPPADALGSLAVLGVVCTALGLWLFFRLVVEAGASRAAVITYVNPLVAVILGVLVLDERFGPTAVAGLVAILAGSWLATRGRRRAEESPAATVAGNTGR